jgi:hypothetical protein
MYLRWSEEKNRPKHYHGGATGRPYAVDPLDGLLLGDVSEADAAEMLLTDEVTRYTDAQDARSRIASYVGMASSGAGPGGGGSFNLVATLKNLVSGKSGKAELRSLFMQVLSDEEETPGQPPAIPEGTPREDGDEDEGDEDGTPTSGIDIEIRTKVAEAYQICEAHTRAELQAECKGRGLAVEKGESKDSLASKLLGLPADWRKKYAQA